MKISKILPSPNDPTVDRKIMIGEHWVCSFVKRDAADPKRAVFRLAHQSSTKLSKKKPVSLAGTER